MAGSYAALNRKIYQFPEEKYLDLSSGKQFISETARYASSLAGVWQEKWHQEAAEQSVSAARCTKLDSN
jgi:hypothetical protein